MRWEIVRTTALQAVVLVVMLSAARPEQAPDAKAPYSSMAPIEQYYVHQYSPQPITEFIISVSKWSDGTAAPTE